MWSSCAYAAAITQRLAAKHSPYPRPALNYPDAGHEVGIMSGYISLTTNGDDGGSLPANGAALADSHTKLLAFLKTK